MFEDCEYPSRPSTIGTDSQTTGDADYRSVSAKVVYQVAIANQSARGSRSHMFRFVCRFACLTLQIEALRSRGRRLKRSHRPSGSLHTHDRFAAGASCVFVPANQPAHFTDWLQATEDASWNLKNGRGLTHWPQETVSSYVWSVQPPSSGSTSTTTCWYHPTFGDNAHRYISPYSFIFQQNKRVSSKVNVTNINSVFSPGRTLYVCDARSDRRYLAVSVSLIATFGTSSLSLDIGLQRLFPDVLSAVFGADFRTAFDLMVDGRHSRLHDQTTKLTVYGIPSSGASRKLTVLEPEPNGPFQQLLAKYPAITRPNLSSSTPPHDIAHHI
ncbi:unnamed protein product [Schistocephalus solidus]|uniref:Integrase catalytic domain-containing protein n=1 Tax=Schistocephalus solidus TaxID=70667 RepID=A0A183SZP5_SCHSO|nr:unnamed protein product [Schistocephalus solidus]